MNTLCLGFMFFFWYYLWGQKSCMGNKICKQLPCQVVSYIYEIEFKKYQSEINWVRMSPFRNFISFELQTRYEVRALMVWSMMTSKTRLSWGPTPAECNARSPCPPTVSCSLWQMTSTFALSVQWNSLYGVSGSVLVGWRGVLRYKLHSERCSLYSLNLPNSMCYIVYYSYYLLFTEHSTYVSIPSVFCPGLLP